MPLITTQHAREKFMKLSGCKTQEQANKTLLKMINEGDKVERRGDYNVLAIMRHGYSVVDYYRHNDWIIVVDDFKVVTCYNDSNSQSFTSKKKGKKRR